MTLSEHILKVSELRDRLNDLRHIDEYDIQFILDALKDIEEGKYISIERCLTLANITLEYMQRVEDSRENALDL